jgi:hypothetical protein
LPDTIKNGVAANNHKRLVAGNATPDLCPELRYCWVKERIGTDALMKPVEVFEQLLLRYVIASNAAHQETQQHSGEKWEPSG